MQQLLVEILKNTNEDPILPTPTSPFFLCLFYNFFVQHKTTKGGDYNETKTNPHTCEQQK